MSEKRSLFGILAEQRRFVYLAIVVLSGAGIWAALQLPMWWQMWQQRNEGGGFAAASVGSGSILLAAVIGFVVGFAWMLRRARRTKTA